MTNPDFKAVLAWLIQILLDHMTPLPLSATLIKASFSPDTAKDLLDHLSQKSVKEIDGETWLYRKDLSYFPEGSE